MRAGDLVVLSGDLGRHGVAVLAARRALGLETAVPVGEEVRAMCELLGLDPIYVASEGRFVAFVAAADVERALAILRAHEPSRGACVIGAVHAGAGGRVVMKSAIGGRRVVDMLSGEQLPRIC
jgi:hydrogenase expression/formation protein HypE